MSDKLIAALKEEIGIRVSLGSSWLGWDGKWYVYERKPYAKTHKALYVGDNLDNAVFALVSAKEVSDEQATP